MTTEDARVARIEAENRIVEILNELEKTTHCKVSGIDLETVEQEGHYTHDSIIISRRVNISLEV